MANLNQSLKEAVCIDEEVFFGPITDKEKKIREQFENLHGNELKGVEFCKIVEDDESQNHSVYKSFSVDESKYDSFDDSLNEEIDKMPQEAKVITMKKSYDKVKSKRSGFYDSLEDVCSLVSNIDKCSISCEVESESNLNSKHFVEDSLKIQPLAIANKNNFKNDQLHFDDDSLAIIGCETTFSDSLEEVNVLENIEIEEINDVEHITIDNQNVALTMNHTCPPKNLFETSIEVICENKKDSDTTDQEESFDDKNLLYDSLSNSDFKDILSDSLEESEQLKIFLSKHLTENVTRQKEVVIDGQNILINVEQNTIYPSSDFLDTSVKIVSEKYKNIIIASPKEPFMVKNISDSFSNSEIKDVSKDSLEESDKSNDILNVFQQNKNGNNIKSEYAYPNHNILDTSVEIVYDNSSNVFDKGSVDNETYYSQENLQNCESFQDACTEQIIKNETGNMLFSISKSACSLQNTSEIFKTIDDDKNTFFSDSPINEDNKVMPKMSLNTDPTIATSGDDGLNIEKETFSVQCAEEIKIETGRNQLSVPESTCSLQNPLVNLENIDVDKNTLLSVSHANKNDKIASEVLAISDPTVTISANDISHIKKDDFSVDSCHLKILNDDINTDEDLKLQLHIEVTAGDKKCQVAYEDIKLAPIVSETSKSETSSSSAASDAKHLSNSIPVTTSFITSEKNEQIMHLNNSELNLKMKESHAATMYSPSEIKPNSHKKSETGFAPNVTQRAKSSTSKMSCSKRSCMDSFRDVSLLQALDLPDLSGSFLNESVIQSADSLIPLNLYSPDKGIQNFLFPQFKNNKNKENIPEQVFEEGNFRSKRKSVSPSKVYNSKTPQSLHKCSSFKETNKKTPGTKIPVRKFDNFAMPAPTPSKLTKPAPATLSAEKVKKCQHSPYSVGSGKKTPGTTSNKAPHICKVRNTIFSKVPQIIPSKKYMNVQSPVAQYIKNNITPVKSPGIDPVLRDCMNHLMESPHHLQQAPTNGSLKSSKKKA